MRTRSLSAIDLVDLPNVDCRSYVFLASSILGAAPEKDDKQQPFRATLPANVQETLTDIEEARDAAQAELDKEPPPPPGARDADRLEDTTVLAFIEILGGWARLKGRIPQGDTAAQLLERLFGDGSTAFINYPVKKEWAVVEGKLKIITAENLEPSIGQLGALPVLVFLQQVHEAYGKAIGVTKAPPRVESPQVRARRDELADALRTYVVRVAAMRDKKKPESFALVDSLLRPLMEWEPATKSTAKSETGGERSDPNNK